MFKYPVDAAVVFGLGETGKILGAADADVCLENYYIVLLDQPQDGTKAVLVHADSMKLLTCHWCLDTQQVSSASFTQEQLRTNTIPTEPCPYCTEKAVVNG